MVFKDDAFVPSPPPDTFLDYMIHFALVFAAVVELYFLYLALTGCPETTEHMEKENESRYTPKRSRKVKRH